MTNRNRDPGKPMATVNVNSRSVAGRWSAQRTLLMFLILGLALAATSRFRGSTAQASAAPRAAPSKATVFDGARVQREAFADWDVGPGQAESILVGSR